MPYNDPDPIPGVKRWPLEWDASDVRWVGREWAGLPNGGTSVSIHVSDMITSFVNGKCTAFIRFYNQWPLKVLYNIAKHSPIHTHIHTPTAESAMQGDSQLAGSSQGEVGCLAQGHLDTQLGGASDQTSNLLVTSQPVLSLYLLSQMPPHS